METGLEVAHATDTPRPSDGAASTHTAALRGLHAGAISRPAPPNRCTSSRDRSVEDIQTAPVVCRSREDDEILSAGPTFLNRALQLKDWFTRAERSGGFDQKFDLTRSFHRPETSYAFFGRLETKQGGVLPVMGAVEDMFYDQTRTPGDDRPENARWMKDQVREFVLRYFMRISSFRPPQAFWRRPSAAQREGLGYSQLFAKRKGEDRIVRFMGPSTQRMLDVREIGSTYDWSIAKVQIFDFSFTVPIVRERAGARFELNEDSYLILSPEFIVDVENPATGVLGEYGFGYAFIHNPGPSLLAFGPGEFEAAYKTFRFRVLETGEVQLHMEFVVNRPRAALRLRLGGLHFDPIYPAIDAINLFTGGYAAAAWGISRDALDRLFLLQHFNQHYQTVTGSLLNWRQIPDWLDSASLPSWVVRGGGLDYGPAAT